MPSKRKQSEVAPGVPGAWIPPELLDQLVEGPMTPEEVQAVCLSFKKALTDHGPIRVEVLRARDGSYEPILVPKHERRFTGFDHKIIAMYARGMTVREIQGLLVEQYGTEVSPEFISTVTDVVMAEVTAWQNPPLEPMYPVIFFDALRVKIREDAVVRDKAVYLSLGVLGIWIEQTEGAKFWLKVFNEFKTRGHFPSNDAAPKLPRLALRNIFADKVRSAYDWKSATILFAVTYGERFTRVTA